MPATQQSLLPRRDYFILPALSILTVVVLCVFAEFASRLLWAEQPHNTCDFQDASHWERRKSDCTVRMKNAEGPWVSYTSNFCGYRSADSCAPLTDNTLRAVIMGTSIAYGQNVAYPDLFATRAAPALARLAGRPVQFQNLGDLGPPLDRQYQFVGEALALKPEIAFLLVNPYDLTRFDSTEEHPVSGAGRDAFHPSTLLVSALTEARLRSRASRALYMAQHWMLEDESFLIRSYASNADPADVSRIKAADLAEQRFAKFSILVNKMNASFRDAGVSFYLLPIPNRVQAALMGNRENLPNFDGSLFLRRVARIALDAGVGCIDMTAAFEGTPHAERLFYPVDGHPTGEANGLIARSVVEYFQLHPQSLHGKPRESAQRELR